MRRRLPGRRAPEPVPPSARAPQPPARRVLSRRQPDATRGDPDRRPRSVASANARWTARRCSAAAERYTAERTSGWRKVTRSPIASSPSVDRRRRGRRAMPRRSAARQSRSGSPTGSAAARSNRRRVSSDSGRLVVRSSPRSVPEDPAASSNPKPPANCVAVNPCGSSSRASGLPRVSATIRSRTCTSSLNITAERQQRAGVAVDQALHL